MTGLPSGDATVGVAAIGLLFFLAIERWSVAQCGGRKR